MARSDDPLQYAGAYCLDLYCDQKGCGACYEAVGQTFADAKKEARREGWVIHRDRTATCGRH